MTEMKDRVRERRLALGLTLEDVAKVVGVTRQTIQKYESGIVTNIPSDKIELLAKALRTTPAFLMGWDDQEATPDDVLTDRDHKDIAKSLNEMEQLLEQGDAMFNGMPMTGESAESFLAALKIGKHLIKTENKKKYTPRKYRKE